MQNDEKRMFGVMVDCSRNAVMNMESLKKFIRTISGMGYNTLMLYTEDTYEVDNEPFFGYLRGRYSKDDIKEIDAYAASHGVELIPCIQTLAHLNAIFKWSRYKDIRDCDDILLADDEKTYELIGNIFSTLDECFTTRRVHIGMDEAYRVGLGEHLDRFGPEKRFDIINRHLHKVCDIAAGYNFTAMIWSDMFFRLALDAKDYYTTDAGTGTGAGDTNGQDPDSLIAKIREQAALPENAELIYWDYYHEKYEDYDRMLKLNKAFGKEVLFAGGAWCWKGFMPDNGKSLRTTECALKACADNDIKDIFITMWGDNGAECSKFTTLPALYFTSEIYRGNTDMEKIRSGFKEMFKADFDDFMMFDKLNEIPTSNGHSYNPCSYLLYNDPFMGLYDFKISSEDAEYYGLLKDKFAALCEKYADNEYLYLFRTAYTLCDALAVKADLGIRTRAAYNASVEVVGEAVGDSDANAAGDVTGKTACVAAVTQDTKSAIRALAEEDYPLVSEKIRIFYDAFKAQWFNDNRPHGFDVQDIRLGGLLQRLESCKNRLIDYADGAIDRIDELEETLLDEVPGTWWNDIVTPNVL